MLSLVDKMIQLQTLKSYSSLTEKASIQSDTNFLYFFLPIYKLSVVLLFWDDGSLIWMILE